MEIYQEISLITAILFVCELIYFRIADRFNIIDKPNQRSSHTAVTLRGGGIVFLMGAWLYSGIYGIGYPFFLTGVSLISLISFADDIRPVSNKIRLVVHLVSMSLLLCQLGIVTTEFWWAIPIALFIAVGIINAYNFMDGINGITGCYSLAVIIPLMYINHYVTPFVDQNLLWVALLSVLVFLFFNFRKRAKCFAGDVGAVGIAYIILFAIGSLIIETGRFEYILLLGVYGVDTALTIGHRIILKENLGEAHRKHAYQLMANELKMDHRIVSSFYMLLQLIVSFGLILLPVNSWAYAIGILLLLCLCYVAFKKKYYWMHEAYLQSNR